jgi:uncharacterized membrane protein
VRLSTYAIAIPAAAAAIVIAFANRQDVVFSLDPFSQATPFFAVEMPLFLLLFLAVLLGAMLSALAVAVSRGATHAKKLLPQRLRGTKTPPG